jgi:hypothetical protein
MTTGIELWTLHLSKTILLLLNTFEIYLTVTPIANNLSHENSVPPMPSGYGRYDVLTMGGAFSTVP